MDILEAGVSYDEIVERAYRSDAGYHQFPLIMHGPGMVICVEAYAGKIGGTEGVKLEEQILILEDGVEVLTQYPFEERLMV